MDLTFAIIIAVLLTALLIIALVILAKYENYKRKNQKCPKCLGKLKSLTHGIETFPSTETIDFYYCYDCEKGFEKTHFKLKEFNDYKGTFIEYLINDEKNKDGT